MIDPHHFTAEKKLRKRKNHFEVGRESRRKNKIFIRNQLEDLNAFLKSIGLQLNSVDIKKKDDTIETVQPEGVNIPEFDLKISGKSFKYCPSEIQLMQTAKAVDSSNLSQRNYHTLRNSLSFTEIPSLYKIKEFKKRLNKFFELKKNEYGSYVNAREKIEFVLKKVYKKLNKQIDNDTFSIKFSGDGTNITRTSVQLLNFTFTVLNDKDKCKTSNGNYILGKNKI